MTATIRDWVATMLGLRRSRLLWIVFFVVALLGLSKAAEFIVVTYENNNWESVLGKKCTQYLAAAEQAFSGVQRVTRRVATEVAQHAVVRGYLAGTIPDQAALFEQVSKVSREQNIGIEVYDKSGSLVAWEGRSGPPHQREVAQALSGKLSSYVSRSPIYGQLFVATPVREKGAVIGAVLVRRTIEVYYPFSNRFINREGLTDQLTRDLGVTVEFNFSEQAELRKDGRYVSAPLYGIDSSRVGVVSVMRPARSASLESMSQSFQRVDACLIAVLVGILVAAVALWAIRVQSLIVRSLVVTALVWIARYVLLWLEIPSAFFDAGYFDPAFFASKFAGGLAKSVGELTLTTIALLVNVLFVTRVVLNQAQRTSPWWHPNNGALRWVAALASTVLLFLLLRGYAASIRSAVFDSILNYSDPLVIVPTYELGFMIFNLFVLSFCLVLVASGLTSFVASLFRNAGRERVGWVVVSGLYLAAAVLFGILQSTPLMSTLYRLLFGAGAIGFTYYLHALVRARRPVASFANFVLILALSSLCLYPFLDENVDEKDRELVEVFAAELTRPADSWLKFVVDEALQSLSTDETKEVLLNGPSEALERLAFTRWAQSSINREGYSCLFAIVDPSGGVMSRFAIGPQSSLPARLDVQRRPSYGKSIQVSKLGHGINAVDIYTGSAPIITGEGGLLGYAIVVVSASQQSLFLGSGPLILRDVSQKSLESFYRPITVSEFRGGTIVSSTNNKLPVGYQLPEQARQQLSDTLVTSVWVDQSIDDKDYETLFVRRLPQSDDVIAMSLQTPGLSWHVVNIVKMMVYCSVIVVFVAVMFFALRRVQGPRYTLTFRDKLLAALLVTALIPLVVMASYGRMSAGLRLMEQTSKRLEGETATVALNLEEPTDSLSRQTDLAITPLMAEQLAYDLGTDFNVYRGNELLASSRPELYEAGILDRRLNGSAYANVIVRGKRFYVETENIGEYRYAVGYRPLLGSDGRVIGVASVPTLYRQDQLDEEVSRQNALVFGVYAIVLFAIVVIATTFANRIAAPIHSLTEATKRIAQGDLDLSVGMPKPAGEIGDLVKAFDTMTHNLKRNREELIRYERELAWKEMAKQVAHEIKNPLTPMKLSLQHLRQTYRDKVTDFDAVFDAVSKTIIEQIDALSRIASEFSHFGRMPTPKREPCDIHGIIRESVALFRGEGSTRFELTLDADLPPVSADREELRRAFINIIRNGMQAMNNAGTMIIATAVENRNVVVTFRDFGVGIPDEVKERLFQPNFSTKTDGMGLGLAIVKKTLDDLKATITIERAAEEGTLVTIRIPFNA